MNGLTGEYDHIIDGKGRLFMPARLREELGRAFYVCKGIDNCLFVFSEENWENIVKKANELPMSKTIATQRKLFSTAYKCEPDAQGRILITQKLKDWAALTKNVTIVGVGFHAEIWDSDRWNDIDSGGDDAIAGIYDSLGL